MRLATESAVKPESAHPFWATGFADVAIVHNGQITNYWKMRRRLEQRDYAFTTDNDSELIAVYLADKLSQGIALRDALATSIDDLDGTFSFLVSTRDEIGYAKDRLAVKPMIMYETDDLVAVASEAVSLNRLRHPTVRRHRHRRYWTVLPFVQPPALQRRRQVLRPRVVEEVLAHPQRGMDIVLAPLVRVPCARRCTL